MSNNIHFSLSEQAFNFGMVSHWPSTPSCLSFLFPSSLGGYSPTEALDKAKIRPFEPEIHSGFLGLCRRGVGGLATRVYVVGVALLVPPVGVVYHSGACAATLLRALVAQRPFPKEDVASRLSAAGRDLKVTLKIWLPITIFVGTGVGLLTNPQALATPYFYGLILLASLLKRDVELKPWDAPWILREETVGYINPLHIPALLLFPETQIARLMGNPSSSPDQLQSEFACPEFLPRLNLTAPPEKKFRNEDRFFILQEWDRLEAGSAAHREALCLGLANVNGARYARAIADLLREDPNDGKISKERKKQVLFSLADEIAGSCAPGQLTRIRNAYHQFLGVDGFDSELLRMAEELKDQVIIAVGQELGGYAAGEGVHFLGGVRKYWGHWLGLDQAAGLADVHAGYGCKQYFHNPLFGRLLLSGFKAGYTPQALIEYCKDKINADKDGHNYALRNPGKILDLLKSDLQKRSLFKKPWTKSGLKQGELGKVIDAAPHLNWDKMDLNTLYTEALNEYITAKFFEVDAMDTPLAIKDEGVAFLLANRGLIRYEA